MWSLFKKERPTYYSIARAMTLNQPELEATINTFEDNPMSNIDFEYQIEFDRLDDEYKKKNKKRKADLKLLKYINLDVSGEKP